MRIWHIPRAYKEVPPHMRDATFIQVISRRFHKKVVEDLEQEVDMYKALYEDSEKRRIFYIKKVIKMRKWFKYIQKGREWLKNELNRDELKQLVKQDVDVATKALEE